MRTFNLRNASPAVCTALIGLLGLVPSTSGEEVCDAAGAATLTVASILQRVASHEFHPVHNGFTRDRNLGKDGIASPDDRDWRVRTLALRDLARLGPDAAPELAAALDHEDVHVRQVAATALGILGRGTATESLERALAGDGDSLVRTQAAIALRQIGNPDTRAALRRALEDPDGDVRHQARLAVHSLQQGYAVEPELADAFKALDEGDFSQAEVGKIAPDFELHTAAGGSWRLSDLRGERKVLLVWIFADW